MLRESAKWDTIDPAQYNVTVTEERDQNGARAYYVCWVLKEDVQGGMICGWVDPATGDVLRTEWYQ